MVEKHRFAASNANFVCFNPIHNLYTLYVLPVGHHMVRQLLNLAIIEITDPTEKTLFF